MENMLRIGPKPKDTIMPTGKEGCYPGRDEQMQNYSFSLLTEGEAPPGIL